MKETGVPRAWINFTPTISIVLMLAVYAFNILDLLGDMLQIGPLAARFMFCVISVTCAIVYSNMVSKRTATRLSAPAFVQRVNQALMSFSCVAANRSCVEAFCRIV